MKASITVSSAVPRTARVLQVSSMMDIDPAKKLARHWDVDLPIENRPWNIGLIVGPSGAGKTTIARNLWPDSFMQPEWDEQPIIDGFPKGMPIKEIQHALGSVGLNTIPAWLRPYGTLSNGERFRADMARVLAETPVGKVAVIDEYSAVVDRQVARVCSHALQKAVRREGKQLVAVSCHYDLDSWLLPDWTYEVQEALFSWGSKRCHPPITLDIRQVPRRYWNTVKHLHYLSAVLPPGAVCYGSFVDNEMVGFTALIRRVHPNPKARRIWVVSRSVTLPDWQGLGIATRTGDWLAQHYVSRGWRVRWLTSHPGLIAHFRRSPHWRQIHDGSAHQVRSGPKSMMRGHQASLRMLRVACFEYRR